MKKKKTSLFIVLLLVINLFAVAGLLLAYTASWVNPAKNWLFAFFGLTFPFILIINIVFVVLWLILWRRYIFIPLIAVLVGFSHIRSLWPVRLAEPEKHGKTTLKVITYNVHRLFATEDGSWTRQTRSEVLDFLASQNAQIICLQEFYAQGREYRKVLQDFCEQTNLPYVFFQNYYQFWNNRKINALATFSRYPIVKSGFFMIRDRLNYAIYTDIVMDEGDTIRVFNLHLESIRLGADDYRYIARIGDPEMDQDQLTLGSKKMFWKLRNAYIKRGQQVEMLKDFVRQSPYPVIVCGDFNDTPFSYTYHTLGHGLSDAYKAAGKEFVGSTIIGRIPFFRIDYILYGEGFTATNYRMPDCRLSDHYPVTVILHH